MWTFLCLLSLHVSSFSSQTLCVLISYSNSNSWRDSLVFPLEISFWFNEKTKSIETPFGYHRTLFISLSLYAMYCVTCCRLQGVYLQSLYGNPEMNTCLSFNRSIEVYLHKRVYLYVEFLVIWSSLADWHRWVRLIWDKLSFWGLSNTPAFLSVWCKILRALLDKLHWLLLERFTIASLMPVEDAD